MLFHLTPVSFDDSYASALLTIDDAKQHLRVDGDEDDALIGALRDAAIELVQKYTGLKLGPTEDNIATFADFGRSMVTGLGPRSSIVVTVVSYIDASGAPVSLSSTDWRIGVDGGLQPAVGASWPSASGPVTMTFDVGFAAGECPKGLIAAVKLMLGYLYANRDAIVSDGFENALPTAVARVCSLYAQQVF